MADDSAAKAAKTPKHRSPNYPAVGLEEALKRAKIISDQGASRHPMPLNIALDLWKYKSGAGNQLAAALKAYGLVEIVGKTDKREIKISEPGRRILLDVAEKPALLKEAALKPPLHAELWEKYNGELPVADAMIKQRLLVDRDFNPSFVDSFISQFRGTIAFAGLTSSDKITDDRQDDGGQFVPDEPQMPTPDLTLNDSGKVQQPLPPPPKGQLPFPLYLSKTQKAMLYVPATMTRAEYDELRKQINHSLDVMKIAALTDDQAETKSQS